jgi:hypothetical protein
MTLLARNDFPIAQPIFPFMGAEGPDIYFPYISIYNYTISITSLFPFHISAARHPSLRKPTVHPLTVAQFDASPS